MFLMRPMFSVGCPALVAARPVSALRRPPTVQAQARDASSSTTINKKAFVSKIVEAHPELNNKTVETVLNATIKTITESVRDGDKITFTGFGTFEKKVRAARTGRNPKTGDPLQIPETEYPSFSAGKNFKEVVKGQ